MLSTAVLASLAIHSPVQFTLAEECQMAACSLAEQAFPPTVPLYHILYCWYIYICAVPAATQSQATNTKRCVGNGKNKNKKKQNVHGTQMRLHFITSRQSFLNDESAHSNVDSHLKDTSTQSYVMGCGMAHVVITQE